MRKSGLVVSLRHTARSIFLTAADAFDNRGQESPLGTLGSLGANFFMIINYQQGISLITSRNHRLQSRVAGKQVIEPCTGNKLVIEADAMSGNSSHTHFSSNNEIVGSRVLVF